MDAGRSAFQQARYLDALQHYRTALEQVDIYGRSPERRGQILTSIGACLLAVSEYKPALAQFLNARPLTLAGGNRNHLAALDANIASVYLFQGDLENARRIYKRALTSTEGEGSHRPLILANLGAIELRERRYRPALEFETAALEAMGETASPDRRATAYDLSGLARLGLRDYAGARRSFERSLELRTEHGGDTSRSLMFLARAELECGRPVAALERFDQSVAAARTSENRETLWQVLYLRGQCRRRLKRLEAAAADLKSAVEVLEGIRPQLIPTDLLRVQFEVSHHQVYGALADVLCQMNRPAEAFYAVELGRAQSLRALVRSRQEPWLEHSRPTLWKRYTERLAHFEKTRLPEDEAEVRELEARMRVDDPVLAGGMSAAALTLPAAQKMLGPDRLLLSFYAGQDGGHLWAVTNAEMRFYRLPSHWADDAERFASAVQAHNPDRDETGRRAYASLLSRVDSPLVRRPHWIIAADGPLALLPFCAMRDAGGEYLVEKHAFTFVPSISVLQMVENRTRRQYEQDFLGLADPLVNRADPRGASSCQDCPSLPRLVASAGEIEMSAGLFTRGRVTLLTGRNASEAGLRESARRAYRFWHISSHVVVDPDRPNHSYIALTLPEKLTVLDVLGLPVRAEMVVLNGCDSGAGKSLPGTGVLGLARAFLAAGADSVCATRWKVPDDSGELVRQVYSHLLQHSGNRAEALRQAQIGMIRAGDWRSEPRYWATYFLFGSPR